MLYKYDSNTLQYKEISLKQYIYSFLIIAVLFTFVGFTTAFKFNNAVEKIAVIIRTNEEEFNEENLKTEIKKLGFKYPHIVYAQAIEETGYFKSHLYKSNNNLFGLKIARLRPSTAIGENLGHAKYVNWKESILDRSLWEAQNTNNIYSEKEYYQLLDAIYAEKSGYSNRLKNIIKQNKL